MKYPSFWFGKALSSTAGSFDRQKCLLIEKVGRSILQTLV